MNTLVQVLRRSVPMLAIILFGVSVIRAQEDEAPEVKQYREDYEQVQKIMTVGDQLKRGDQLLAFLKERPTGKMTEYVEENFMRILDGLLRQKNNVALQAMSKRMIDQRPKTGESYYFYGTSLRNAGKFPEAMDALAKCYVIKNKLSGRAKEDLDTIYKGRNAGSLNGEEKIIKQAQESLAK